MKHNSHLHYYCNLVLGFCVLVLFVHLVSGCSSTPDKPTGGGTTIVDITSYPDLAEGDTGEYVKIAQQKLGITADGEFGPGTKRAVAEFQTKNNIQVNFPGTIGQKTWKVLLGEVTVTPSPAPTPPTVEIPSVSGVPALSWDNQANRKEWSKQVYGLIYGELWPKFSKVSDGKRMCNKWDSLNKEQKAHVLSEMIVWTVYRESGWDPTSRMFETTMGYYSEGLLQLSYPDVNWAKYCKFNKAADDAAYPNPKDPRRSILRADLNLDCGLRIMADQINKRPAIFQKEGNYWAVLKTGGKYSKVDEITAKTQALAMCK